jgi:glycosyltransferase involved in cell wall biosynthesis
MSFIHPWIFSGLFTGKKHEDQTYKRKKSVPMDTKHFISVIIPAYNEESILEENIQAIAGFLKEKTHKYQWEIIIVNDGSKDNTGKVAEEMAGRDANIKVTHHRVNKNLGHALRTGFSQASGEAIVVMDVDLSYSVDHIESLADTLFEEVADVVIASPYMPGGKSIAVPRLRLWMSKAVNRIMRMAAQEKYYTFTGMVRAYRAEFIKKVNLKTRDYEVNPEILYKAMILRARIREIPARLDWSAQKKKKNRKSHLKVGRGIFSGFMSSFIFRPYIYFLAVGFITLVVSLYIIGWIFYHTITVMPELEIEVNYFDDRFSYALGRVFHERPHSFLVGGFTFVVSLLFLGIGFISLQSKRYFEELFHLVTNKNNRD